MGKDKRLVIVDARGNKTILGIDGETPDGIEIWFGDWGANHGDILFDGTGWSRQQADMSAKATTCSRFVPVGDLSPIRHPVKVASWSCPGDPPQEQVTEPFSGETLSLADKIKIETRCHLDSQGIVPAEAPDPSPQSEEPSPSAPIQMRRRSEVEVLRCHLKQVTDAYADLSEQHQSMPGVDDAGDKDPLVIAARCALGMSYPKETSTSAPSQFDAGVLHERERISSLLEELSISYSRRIGGKSPFPLHAQLAYSLLAKALEEGLTPEQMRQRVREGQW